MALPEVLSPDTIGEALIRVTLAVSGALLLANQPIQIAIDYSQCLPSGVVLPIVISVSSAFSQTSYVKKVFTRSAPTAFAFTPKEGGPHVITVREAFHNYWTGVLKITVGGDRLKEGTL